MNDAELRARRIEAEMALLAEQDKARATQRSKFEELAAIDPKRAAKKAEKLARKQQSKPHTFICRGCTERFYRARNATGPDVWKCEHCGHDNTPPRAEGRIIPPHLAAWHHEQSAVLAALAAFQTESESK